MQYPIPLREPLRFAYYRLKIAARYGLPSGRSQSVTQFAVTGIPRSGTSLLSKLISEQGQMFCLNEVDLSYNVHTLRQFLATIHSYHARRGQLPSMVSKDGRLASNTMFHDRTRVGEVGVRQVSVPGAVRALGAKVTVDYLVNLGVLLENFDNVFVVVRDPVFTIASWVAVGLRQPWGRYERHLQGRGREDPERSTRNLRRLCADWIGMMEIIQRFADCPNLIVIRFESLVQSPAAVVGMISHRLGIEATPRQFMLDDPNKRSRYAGLSEKEETLIRELCGPWYDIELGSSH